MICVAPAQNHASQTTTSDKNSSLATTAHCDFGHDFIQMEPEKYRKHFAKFQKLKL